MNNNSISLSEGTLLQGKYKIIRKLGQGGFGITYLSLHVSTGRLFAIKEFFFRECCQRNSDTNHVEVPSLGQRELVERFRKKFIKEANTLRSLKHKGIVAVEDVFEQNSTSYYVMYYIEGESLSSRIQRSGAMNVEEATGVLKQISAALQYIHGLHINHLDIKPDNIMLEAYTGNAVLIDFGVSKHYDAESLSGTTTTPAGISHGYSPLEQYSAGGVNKFSPQSDIYALGATLFFMLTAKCPPQAIELAQGSNSFAQLDALSSEYECLVDAVKVAMQSSPLARPATVGKFMDIALHGSGKKDESPEGATTIVSIDTHSRKRNVKRTLIIGCAVAAIAVLMFFAMNFSQKAEAEPELLLLDSVVEEEIPPFEVERFSQAVPGTTDCHLTIDYPSNGNPQLVDSIRSWINKELGGSYTGDFSNGNALLSHYLPGCNAEGEMTDSEIIKMYETDTYITFRHKSYSQYEGAIHGIGFEIGATFRKSDGLRLSHANSGGFNQYRTMVIEGLKKYFDVTNINALDEQLQIEEGVDNLPAPSWDPWLTPDGMVFSYGSYEIAPYSAGYPTAVIPITSIKHILDGSTPGFL